MTSPLQVEEAKPTSKDSLANTPHTLGAFPRHTSSVLNLPRSDSKENASSSTPFENLSLERSKRAGYGGNPGAYSWTQYIFIEETGHAWQTHFSLLKTDTLQETQAGSTSTFDSERKRLPKPGDSSRAQGMNRAGRAWGPRKPSPRGPKVIDPTPCEQVSGSNDPRKAKI